MKEKHPVFRTCTMRPEHAKEICSWSYPAPYNIYGWLPWEKMVELGIEFGDPALRASQYISVVDEQGRLWGFAQLFPMEGVTRLGLGLRPDCCGQGMGKHLVKAVVKEAMHRAPGHEIDLEVLTWNERAIRAYRKAGFVITDTYEKRTPEGMSMFYCMVYAPSRFGSDVPKL